MNSISFLFKFSKYKNDMKSAQILFHSFDEYEKVKRETRGHLTWSLISAKNDLNNTHNLFQCFKISKGEKACFVFFGALNSLQNPDRKLDVWLE